MAEREREKRAKDGGRGRKKEADSFLVGWFDGYYPKLV
jgi:hypothetical protein